jgi:GNAT superfamily N-acetyltransferase
MNHQDAETGCSVKIEKVNRDNLKDFLVLITELARYERDVPPDDDAKRRLETDALSRNPPFHAFVVYSKDRPVGYIIHYYTYSTYDGRRIFFLEDIFVKESERRTGVGRNLFDFCLEEAKRQGCCEIQWAVLTWNKDAISFYERLGGKRLDLRIYSIEEKNFP